MHPGQKIHSSLLLARGADKYIPKARPYATDEGMFWEQLRNKGIDSEYAAQWLEVDLYESAQAIVESFTGPNCAALQRMRGIATSGKTSQFIENFPTLRARLGEGRRALYKTVVDTLRTSANPTNQYELLRSAMEILSRIFQDDPPVKLVTPREILPCVSRLLTSDNKECHETAREFMARFTTRE
jgi:hypothetical protein